MDAVPHAANFLGTRTSTDSLSPGASLLYFAVVAAVIFGFAIFVVERRDA